MNARCDISLSMVQQRLASYSRDARHLDRAEDEETVRLCLESLARINHTNARKELIRIQNPALAQVWKIIAAYINIRSCRTAGRPAKNGEAKRQSASYGSLSARRWRYKTLKSFAAQLSMLVTTWSGCRVWAGETLVVVKSTDCQTIHR